MRFRDTHPTLEQCLARWPRIARLIQDHRIMSESEAGCVLRDYIRGHRYSCEACSQSGLSPADVMRMVLRPRSESYHYWWKVTHVVHGRWRDLRNRYRHHLDYWYAEGLRPVYAAMYAPKNPLAWSGWPDAEAA